jgi:hypothetical protein
MPRGDLVTDIRLLADSATPPRAIALRLSNPFYLNLSMPRGGFEPPRVLSHYHLKVARLPVPPPGLDFNF